MKNLPVRAELFYADGRTDGRQTEMTKLTVAFRNSANAPKKGGQYRNNVRHRQVLEGFPALIVALLR
jgi:hypothetical protein